MAPVEANRGNRDSLVPGIAVHRHARRHRRQVNANDVDALARDPHAEQVAVDARRHGHGRVDAGILKDQVVAAGVQKLRPDLHALVLHVDQAYADLRLENDIGADFAARSHDAEPVGERCVGADDTVRVEHGLGEGRVVPALGRLGWRGVPGDRVRIVHHAVAIPSADELWHPVVAIRKPARPYVRWLDPGGLRSLRTPWSARTVHLRIGFPDNVVYAWALAPRVMLLALLRDGAGRASRGSRNVNKGPHRRIYLES